MRRTKKEVDDFEAILEEGRRAKKQKRLEKVQLGKNGKMAKMEKKDQGADNVEKVPRQEKSALLTADNNNIKIKTEDNIVNYKKNIEDYRAFFENDQKTENGSDEVVENVTTTQMDFETGGEKAGMEDESAILSAIQRGEEEEEGSWQSMAAQNGGKGAKMESDVEEKVWQISPSGDSGLKFSLKAVKSEVESDLTCNGCGHKYDHKSFLKRHLKRGMCSKDSQLCKCKCGYFFKTRDSLRRHIKKDAETNPQEHGESEEKAECEESKGDNKTYADDQNMSKSEELDSDENMDTKDKDIKDEVFVTLKGEGVEQLLSRYSELVVVQKRPREQTEFSGDSDTLLVQEPIKEEDMISKELPLQMIEITSQLESESGLSEEKESKYALQIKSEQSRWFHPKTLSQSKLGRHQSAITVDQVRNLLYVSESELFISNFSICNFLQVCQFLGLRDYPLPQLPFPVTEHQEEFERF